MSVDFNLVKQGSMGRLGGVESVWGRCGAEVESLVPSTRVPIRGRLTVLGMVGLWAFEKERCESAASVTYRWMIL